MDSIRSRAESDSNHSRPSINYHSEYHTRPLDLYYVDQRSVLRGKANVEHSNYVL